MINKTAFLNYLSCPSLGWMTKRDMLPKFSGLNNELLVLESRIVHSLSRQLFPDAISAGEFKPANPVAITLELMANPTVKTIYDASFIVDGYYVRADILQRLDDGSWHLFEVKSGSKYKAKYVNDVSFKTMVLFKAGFKIGKTDILHLSNNYRLGMPLSKLFQELACTEEIKPKFQEYLNLANKAFRDIESDTMPAPYLKVNCKNCPMFDVCMGKGVKNHIFNLPRLSRLAIEKLIALGADTIDKVPKDFEFTDAQEIVRKCILTDTKYTSEKLKTELKNIKQPFYYLDFESITTTMPLYPDIAPHTQILTQFSLDKTDELGNILNHYEYIADPKKDSRRELTEKVIEYLGDKGSVITYANSERIYISKLKSLFPELTKNLNNILKRIVDLELIVKKNYYDVNFCGRSSIKKVLPVLVPEMSYQGLEISDGGTAAAAFSFMAMGLYDTKKIEETKKNLLKYCAQDTLAMIKIHQFLLKTAQAL